MIAIFKKNLFQNKNVKFFQFIYESFVLFTEPFSEWLEEKVDLPIFEEFSAPHDILQTQTLLQEFENVCGAVGINHQHQHLTHLTHLTPPQSPPFHQPQYAFQPSHATYPTHVPQPSPVHNWQPDILVLEQQSQTELARELAVVEELVLRRAQDVTCNDRDIKPIPSPVSNESDNSVSDYYHPVQQYSKEDEYSSQVAVTPPEHAYAKSTDENFVSGPFSPNSNSSYSLSGSSENEDEWGPSSSSSGASLSGRQKSYSRSKPYSRNPDDKRSRKKEQNKNAATRYRQKKKQEVEVLAGEEKELMDVHDELQGKCSDLQREVKYLKGLMRDLCRAKGLIK